MEVIAKPEVALLDKHIDSEPQMQTRLEPDAEVSPQTRLEAEGAGLEFEGEEYPTLEDWEELEKNPPADLQALIARLDDVFSESRPARVNVEFVQRMMTAYASNRADWAQFAKFDRYRYTRNLVAAGNGRYNLMLLCWGEGQASSIHDHANSHCFMKNLQGTLQETRYGWPSDGAGRMEPVGSGELALNQVAYINDSLGLHRVENASHSEKAVSLHLYSPPFDECGCFEEKSGRRFVCRITFWSRYGKLVPHLSQAPSAYVPESNSTNAESNTNKK